MKKILALLMTLLMVAACFAGCGKSGNDNDGDVSGEPTKTIVVGYTIYEPMNYLDESGKLIGYDTELAEAVFKNLGYKPIFKEIEWANRYTDLNSGVIDCIWNGFTCNTTDDDGVKRAEKVDFSYNYMRNKQVIVVKDTSNIASAADLKDKIGYSEAGSAGEGYAKSFEGVVSKTAIKQTDCLVEVKAGTADFAVLDEQLAKSYCGQGDYANLKIVESLSSEVEFYAIGFKKGSELTAKVNAELEKLGKDGTIKALAEKYEVVNTALTTFTAEEK